MTEYNGWLVSNNFIKRVLAVTGYTFVGQISLTALIILIIKVLP